MNEKLASYSSVLGVVVANKRKELGIEQSDIAAKMGLSQASYSRLESGKSTFSVDQLFGCASALGVPVEELFQKVVNTVKNLQQSKEVSIQAPSRGNASGAQQGSNGAAAVVAGAALAALIIGLMGKSK
ncbi:helix-turn-helix transcriptional regulator [Enterovibrio norvegicus]|uniref:helix-turn-helix domain-containing protein n=1 Tax=Enterovibrio norvegicus TaxID=188144 RepID=UPI0010BF3E83|nr:helix-turn-helix transcriptional regulator [Enterovibrio norvegicus]TKF15895.1 helix-turn-helix transcriptional regulator [Enterovibrio norvegicus]